jgi:hypothetical protein
LVTCSKVPAVKVFSSKTRAEVFEVAAKVQLPHSKGSRYRMVSRRKPCINPYFGSQKERVYSCPKWVYVTLVLPTKQQIEAQ